MLFPLSATLFLQEFYLLNKYDLCFEEPRTRAQAVYAAMSSPVLTTVEYKILPGGQVFVSPWPFAFPVLTGIVVGYQLEGYPTTLRPMSVPFCIEQEK